MKRITFFMILSMATFLAACKEDLGPYREITRSYPLDNFDQLNVAGAIQVDVQSGNIFNIDVRGNEADINDLQLVVRQGVLYAQHKNSGRRNRYDTYITITMPTIRAINFSSAAKGTIKGFLNLDAMGVELSGAAKANLTMNVSRLSSSLSGASMLTLTGEGTKLVSELSGASKLEAYDFLAPEGDFDVSGASEARIQIKDVLKIKASGASKVRYRGNPRTNIETSGASTVTNE